MTFQPETNLRKGDLTALVDLLREQDSYKWDVVAPAASLRSVGGRLQVSTSETVTQDGYDVVFDDTADLIVNTVAEEGIAERLGIPLNYVRRLRAEHLDLYDQNLNGWFERYPAKSWLVRTIRSEDHGVARAFLSDRYRPIDHLDVLLAALDGARQSGTDITVSSADLTDRRMVVRFESAAVAEAAPELLALYRDPASGRSGTDYPIVRAGFDLRNSETGGGAFTITPRLTFLVCSNGMTRTTDQLRKVHVGGQLDDGIIRWSEETQERTIGLITSQVRDAVATFIDRGYLRRCLDELAVLKGVAVAKPVETIQLVAKQLRMSEARQQDLLDHFIRGADFTALGVAQACTSLAQTVDGDSAVELEDYALVAANLVAASR